MLVSLEHLMKQEDAAAGTVPKARILRDCVLVNTRPLGRGRAPVLWRSKVGSLFQVGTRCAPYHTPSPRWTQTVFQEHETARPSRICSTSQHEHGHWFRHPACKFHEGVQRSADCSYRGHTMRLLGYYAMTLRVCLTRYKDFQMYLAKLWN